MGGRSSTGGNAKSSAESRAEAKATVKTASKLSKKKQEWVDSLKDKSNSELGTMLFNARGLYSKKDLTYVQAELDSRKSVNTTQKWDSDIQDWFNSQMISARAGGASVDTMVAIEANLRDQANRRQRDRRRK